MIDELIAKLESATEGAIDLDREIEAYLFPQHRTLIFRDKWDSPPRTRSLDAALPGEKVCEVTRVHDNEWIATAYDGGGGRYQGRGKTEPLARRIAALRARAAA